MSLDQAIVPVVNRPSSLTQFERIRRQLAEAVEVDEVKDVRDKAEALRLYLRQAGESMEMQNAVAEIKLRAERRAGELLAEMEKNRGTAGTGDANIGNSTGGHTMLPPVNDRPTLADLGISKMQSSRWQQIAALP